VSTSSVEGAQTSSKLPPGPRNVGVNTFKWMARPAELLDGGQARYGDVWSLPMLAGTTFVIVSDPDLMKDVFTADPTVLHAGHANMFIGTALLGEHSVILLDEGAHMTQRKLLLPHFGGERVARYRTAMAQICEEELETWPLHEPMELLPLMQSITRKVIMSAIFGVTGGERQELLGTRIREMLDWGAHRFLMAKLHFATKRGSKLPRSFTDKRDPLDAVVFEEIERARRDPRLPERDDILAMLVQARHEDGEPMSDREIRDEMITLLIQGHQSTATTLAWALERILHTPDAWERLSAETRAGSEEYLDATAKETLRLRPPIPLVVRWVAKPFTLGEYRLEVGTVVAPCMYLLHRRPDLYPEPERFRPERFLERSYGPYEWLPFGGGDRHCIGRNFATCEIKEVLHTLALRTRLAPTGRRDEKIRKRGILLSPSDGASAVLEERTPAAAPAAASVRQAS
jgi:cytochrome P450